MTSPDKSKAFELRLAGATYESIASVAGFKDAGAAQRAVVDVLAGRLKSDPAEVLGVELARLDALLTGLWPAARRGDTQAVDRVLKISERRVHIFELAASMVPSERSTADELKAKRNARLGGSQVQARAGGGE